MSRQYALEEIANIPIKSSQYPDGRPAIVDTLICADGFELSVQASEFHLCEPKNNTGPWVEFEVRTLFNNASWLHLAPYLLEEDDDERTLSNVPIDVLRKVIDIHGGLLLGGVTYTYVPSGVDTLSMARNFMVSLSDESFLYLQDGIRNINHKDKKCNLMLCSNCSYFKEVIKNLPTRTATRAFCPITLLSHPHLLAKSSKDERRVAIQEYIFAMSNPPKEIGGSI